MLTLNTIKAHPGALTKRRRLGRGPGSGRGGTSGKGDKGQLARTGGHVRPGFEGGQMPLYRRLPKRGFKNVMHRTHAIINVGDLEKFNPAQMKEVSLDTLVAAGKLKGRFEKLAVLGEGSLTKPFIVKAHRVSASAQEKLKKAGGSFEILGVIKYTRVARSKKSKQNKTQAAV